MAPTPPSTSPAIRSLAVTENSTTNGAGHPAGASDAHASKAVDEIRRRQFSLLVSQLPETLLGNGALVVLTAIAFAGAVDSVRTILWLSFSAICFAPSALAGWRLRGSPPRRAGRRLQRRIVANALILALPWAAAAMFLLSPDDSERTAFFVFVIAGLSAGTMATLSPVPAASVTYVAAVVVPLALRLVSLGGRFETVMAVMLALYCFYLYRSLQRAYRQFAREVHSDIERDDLVLQIAEGRDSLIRANAELERRVLDRTESLRASEARQRALLENSSDVIATIDRKGIITYITPSATQLLGIPADQLEGRSARDLLNELTPTDKLTLPSPSLSDRHQDGRRVRWLQLRSRSGETRIWQAISGDLDSNGVEGRIVNARDVTEQVHNEELLREAQKLEAIGKLTGGVAHDFNNYLAIILGNLELMQMKLAGREDIEPLLANALRGADRASELTHSLLAFSRRSPLTPRRVDPAELVMEIARLLERTLGASIKVELDVAPDVWPVLVDEAQLGTALINLANNARDAMPQGGILSICVHNVPQAGSTDAGTGAGPDDQVRIEVRDTGHGMDREVQANAVQPFFTTKPAGHGTGLGLSMVYGFVKQSGGTIEIHSVPGQGTSVQICLPRARNAPPATPSAPAAPAAIRPATNHEAVLAVEDNDMLREIVALRLANLGYRVTTAEHAEAALQIIRDPSQAIDLLFTDILMPGNMTGIVLADEARRIRPGLRVLLTSGYSGHELEAASRNAVGYPLLSKPYSQELLARMVRDALDA